MTKKIKFFYADEKPPIGRIVIVSGGCATWDDQVDLRTDAEHGQLNFWQDECEGMCGV